MFTFPLVFRFQRDEDDSDVGRVDESVDGETGKCDCARDARLLQRDRRHLTNYSLGSVECRCVRQLRECHEIRLVLRGHEAVRHFDQSESRQAYEA